MSPHYLNQLKLPINGRGIYLDCGVLFPFYFKDADIISPVRWASDVCELITHNQVKTTMQVWKEVRRAYIRIPMNKQVKNDVRHLYNKIDSKLVKIMGITCGKDTVLSPADLSLLNRPDKDMVLITADKGLFFRDKNSILLEWDMKAQELSYRTE